MMCQNRAQSPYSRTAALEHVACGPAHGMQQPVQAASATLPVVDETMILSRWPDDSVRP
jgi:hypothetical protein